MARASTFVTNVVKATPKGDIRDECDDG